MKKLLITGGSGFLGWHLCRDAVSQWEVTGIYHAHPIEIPGVRFLKTDLTQFQAVQGLFEKVRPDAVIHTAADADLNRCQKYPRSSYRINVDATRHVARCCADDPIPFLFTSTDCVFDGLRPPYGETDGMNPVNMYGEQKALAEEKAAEIHPKAIIVRLALLFGDPAPAHESFATQWMRAMVQKRPLKLFTDEYRTPLSVRFAVLGLFLALQKAEGILHLGGGERQSRFDFGKLLAQQCGISSPDLIPCLRKDFSGAPRPADVSLKIEKARSLGFEPLPLCEEIQRLCGEGTGASGGSN